MCVCVWKNSSREFVRIWYRDQPKTCRRCEDLGHLINECTSVRCFNCEKSGHRAEACEQPIMCSICVSEEHRERRCPFLLYSTNIDVQPSSESYSYVASMKSGNPPSSAASVASTPRVPPAHSTLGYWPSAKKSFVNMQEKARSSKSTEESQGCSEKSDRRGCSVYCYLLASILLSVWHPP